MTIGDDNEDGEEEEEETEGVEDLNNTDEDTTQKTSGSSKDHANAKEKGKRVNKAASVASKSSSYNGKSAHAIMATNGKTSTHGRRDGR